MTEIKEAMESLSAKSRNHVVKDETPAENYEDVEKDIANEDGEAIDEDDNENVDTDDLIGW